MAKYDLQDPDDLYIMRAEFESYSAEDWDRYIELAKKHKLGFKNIGALMNARKKAGISKYLGDGRIQWALNLVDQIEDIIEDEKKDQKASSLIEKDQFFIPKSHITLRVAWHDNKWNGSICKDPLGNTYCSGFNSLLSERIRKRKDENIDKELKYSGQNISDIAYLPPCFWSVNLFGKEPIKAIHDNPAAPNLKPIEEELAAQSMYSWPFAVSFTRTQKEQKESGAYPKNLEETRIPRFSAKLKEGESIAFMYAKFSNPITEEDRQYLVVGAGIVDKKQKAADLPHFEPESEIEKIRDRPISNHKYRNFPSMNWAMQFSFADYSAVRLPYHEYLDAAEKLSPDAQDGFLDKIKVAITEPELEWCFKYVAMDIGDDEAIYILTKMRKSLISCQDDAVVPREEMLEKIEKVEELLRMAWSSRSYFPGFSNISRVLLNQTEEPKFPLEQFYSDFKIEENPTDELLLSILSKPEEYAISKSYAALLYELKDRIEQKGFTQEEFLQLCMLNLKPFQFKRILNGKLALPNSWIRNFADDVKYSHEEKAIISNPYLLYEDYEFWPDSHDDVYGEELDAPIDLFKIDIAYFPDTRFVQRINLQRTMKFADKRRIRALILRHLDTLENSGDCFTHAEELQKQIANYPLYYELGEDYSVPRNLFHPLPQDYANHFNEGDKLVLVEANDTMYYFLFEVYNAEKGVEKNISELLRKPDNDDTYPEYEDHILTSAEKLKSRIGNHFQKEVFKEERRELIQNFLKKRFYVVAGGAGSGKSYEALKFIEYLYQEKNQKYIILAPTGKAALRLSSDKDFPNIEASTIDKFINDVKNHKISQAQIRQYQNVVIDETSMVDLLKFNKLLKIFNFKEASFKRLILIGDPNQLPAIGYGRVLEDIISYLRSDKNYKDNFIQLETNCRSELAENAVTRLAESFKVNAKDDIDPDIRRKLENRDVNISEGFRIQYWENKDSFFTLIGEEFKRLTEELSGNTSSKLNQLLGLSEDGDILNNELDIENFQILSPYHSQYSGATGINDYIQSVFKKDLKYQLRKDIFKESDKLIRTQNYYVKEKLVLSNGTLGFLKGSDEKFFYESDNGITGLPLKEIRSSEKEFFELAYAITIHKSQGSGFNHLFLVIPERYGLLSKELIYTALTRTKKSITVFLQVSDKQIKNPLDKALERSYSASRKTSLLLDKPYRFYDLEPEKGVFVESRVELLIYHVLMKKRDELGRDKFNFSYEEKPIIDGETVNIKTDFTIYANNKIWYWEHLGLLGQRKYTWTWKNIKTKTYREAGIWEQVITTDERNGIAPHKIESLVDLIINDKVSTEDKFTTYSKHHYLLR